jgi:hypothetical protein
MDIGNRFSLEDFLAYFFPGVMGSLGIYALLQLSPLGQELPSLSTDLTTGIIFFVLSYIVGVIFSGFSELIFARVKGYKEVIPLNDDLKQVILKAFKDTFKITKKANSEWSRDHFYLCRSLVYENIPNILPVIQRQSGLRQLRISLMPGLFIWFLAGVVWGIQEIAKNAVTLGIIIVLGSAVLFLAITIMTINRARSNEWREVREVLTAFAAGYEKGSFREKNKIDNHKVLEKV